MESGHLELLTSLLKFLTTLKLKQRHTSLPLDTSTALVIRPRKLIFSKAKAPWIYLVLSQKKACCTLLYVTTRGVSYWAASLLVKLKLKSGLGIASLMVLSAIDVGCLDLSLH